MRIVVNLLHIVKAQSLIDDNEFLQSVLEQESSGSWWINDDTRESLKEIKRLFISKNIQFKIKD